ncbi:MAG: type II toxin-antitoxin system VapC family toxin [Acidobacteria bacterium]|nr:type II toxin-antitoxin system VapC family toxin [Acidobacteriota bacterium]
MIHVDTSALIAALTGARTAAPVLRGFISDGLRMAISTPVLYEWDRGPRTAEERDSREILFPSDAIFGFGLDDALLAAELYRRMARPRGREIDIAIAAYALTNGAALWTLNPTDFTDIPGLTLAT